MDLGQGQRMHFLPKNLFVAFCSFSETRPHYVPGWPSDSPSSCWDNRLSHEAGKIRLLPCCRSLVSNTRSWGSSDSQSWKFCDAQVWTEDSGPWAPMGHELGNSWKNKKNPGMPEIDSSWHLDRQCLPKYTKYPMKIKIFYQAM